MQPQLCWYQMSEVNMASEENAKKIIARLKTYDEDYRRVLVQLKQMENTIQTLNNKLDSQMELYKDFFVKQYGSGPTEREL